jgi:hypothetical protein
VPTDALYSQTAQTLQILRSLGVGIIHVDLQWHHIAPYPDQRFRPLLFDATNPASYPQGNWAPYDQIVAAAAQYGIRVEFVVNGGAPLWATQRDAVAGFEQVWDPSPTDYGQFVQAVGARYPTVHLWELWNEPNWGYSLAPQLGVQSPQILAVQDYRSMLNEGWSGLQRSGHHGDVIIAGGLAPDGSGKPLNPISTISPLAFVRGLYCVDASFEQLSGNASQAIGCPGTAAQLRANYPGLFAMTGFGVHPYSAGAPPTRPFFGDRDAVEFSEIPNLINTLDRLQTMYGSPKRMDIYNTEFGYETKPPQPASTGFATPSTAASYLNWAEYLSWRNPRIMTTAQYELRDSGWFTSGLLFADGQLKPSFYSYRFPLYLPRTVTRAGRALEVWGDLRPAAYARSDTGRPQTVLIQFRPRSSGTFRTIKGVVITNASGYFDLRVKFPATGAVRLAWAYPRGDERLIDPLTPRQQWIYSRTVTVTVRSARSGLRRSPHAAA